MSGDDHSREGPGRGQQDGPPPPQPVRVAGILDTISASQPEILLRLKDETLVPGHLQHHDPDELRTLFATPVVISGLARFNPDRRLVLVDVEYIGPARPQDAMWETAPVPRPDASAPVAHLVNQDKHARVCTPQLKRRTGSLWQPNDMFGNLYSRRRNDEISPDQISYCNNSSICGRPSICRQ